MKTTTNKVAAKETLAKQLSKAVVEALKSGNDSEVHAIIAEMRRLG